MVPNATKAPGKSATITLHSPTTVVASGFIVVTIRITTIGDGTCTASLPESAIYNGCSCDLKDFAVKERILLHSCCAPCSSAILEWLLQNDYAPHVFYYNPNIFPEEEYLVRKNECIRYCETLGVPFTDGDWEHGVWREAVKGHEADPERGQRCRLCFGVRMRATAAMAQSLGIERFTTTLAGSRWKRLDQIREAAQEAAALYPGTRYWDQNWRKGGLQERRGEILREQQFYNQLWCGCEFSMGHLKERNPSELPAHMAPYLEALGLVKKD